MYLPDPNNRDASGWTALMHAAAWGDIDVISWLLDYAQGWNKEDTGMLTQEYRREVGDYRMKGVVQP